MDYTLNDLMEFDHVVIVADGVATSYNGPAYAPEVYWSEGEPEETKVDGWTLETGWTGQYSYNGPHMHPSEFIGGRLADYVLETDGLWVAVVVEDITDQDNPVGWAIAHREIG